MASMKTASQSVVKVNALNFNRAESDGYLAAIEKQVGGVNRWFHYRAPTDVHQQTILRMNRDTLYSATVVDISAGATLTLPETSGRYQTAMIVNQDHYINRVFDRPGAYALTLAEFDTPWVLVAVRTLVDGADPADVQKVVGLQDQLGIAAASQQPFASPTYDRESLKATRDAIAKLGEGVADMRGAFGSRADVHPIAHLIGTARGWGGLPDSQAFYEFYDDPMPTGHYVVQVDKVPVRAFWSLTVYNPDGFLEPNQWGRYSINSLMAVRNADGTVTVNLGGDPSLPNQIPLCEGWNYAVRLYQPGPEVLDGTWRFPTIGPA